MSSHRAIHYGLRPAKNIERKMICETFQRLAHFGNLHEYRYVGFGSRYFSDFTLIHKTLGIHQMISIEKDTSNKDWFEFNRPYKCIEAVYDHSNSVLPSLDWTKPTILWLDYDGILDKAALADISSFCSGAAAGSILMVTVNADVGRYKCEEDRLSLLKEAVGEAYVPSGTKISDLGKTRKPTILRKIVDDAIQEHLSIRNGVLTAEDKIEYLQLFNFVYEDGAQMLTVGGMIFNEGQTRLLDKCAFSDFEFIRSGEDNYAIEVPNLTIREIHYLNQHLPSGCGPSTSFIPLKEIKQYAKIYRYFPAFTEAEV